MKKKIGHLMLISGIIFIFGIVGGIETGQTNLFNGTIYGLTSFLVAYIGGKISEAFM